ncbi:MAG: hydroxyacylglutathione hydrolase [Proteobacteria bacterium]|nr:hydroxyacylglutathione hydrolase [Pseudomonadota bacterium]MCL2306925.1 hydroxyacylglutathione hydrolase [Pseudomonadota bacterium]
MHFSMIDKRSTGVFRIIPVCAFADNFIWLIHDGRHAVAVDVGDATPLLERLDALNLTLSAVLCTHHHADHVGGNAALVARCPAPVYGPENERIPARTVPLRGGETLVLPGLEIPCRVLAVPGHTLGHLAYAIETPEGTALFCGDALFSAGCGRIFEGTAAMMWQSLSALATLPETTRIYCGHEYTLSNLRFARAVEPDNAALIAREAAVRALREAGKPSVPSTLAEERATNPFLRVDVPAVQAAVRAYSGLPCVTAPETFAVLRTWRDDFIDTVMY